MRKKGLFPFSTICYIIIHLPVMFPVSPVPALNSDFSAKQTGVEQLSTPRSWKMCWRRERDLDQKNNPVYATQWDSSPAQYDAQNKAMNAQSNRKSKYVEDPIADTHVFPCTYRHFWGKVRLHRWFKLLWIVSEAFLRTLYGEHSITLYNGCFYYKTCNI